MFGNDSIEMKEEYDVVTLSGGFVPGHVPMTALNDFIQMCKPGGIITIVMRYEYLHVCPDYQQMEQLMKDLEHQSKKWKQIKRQITPNYLLDKEGITFVFQKVWPTANMIGVCMNTYLWTTVVVLSSARRVHYSGTWEKESDNFVIFQYWSWNTRRHWSHLL